MSDDFYFYFLISGLVKIEFSLNRIVFTNLDEHILAGIWNFTWHKFPKKSVEKKGKLQWPLSALSDCPKLAIFFCVDKDCSFMFFFSAESMIIEDEC